MLERCTKALYPNEVSYTYLDVNREHLVSLLHVVFRSFSFWILEFFDFL